MIKTILSSALIVMALVVSIQQQAKAIEQIPYYPPLKGDQIQKELHREKEISIWHNFTSTSDNHTSPTVLISSPPIFNKQAGSVIWACSTTLDSIDMKNDKKVGKIVRNGLKLCDNDMPILKASVRKLTMDILTVIEIRPSIKICGDISLGEAFFLNQDLTLLLVVH